jgi:hypothetical protein
MAFMLFVGRGKVEVDICQLTRWIEVITTNIKLKEGFSKIIKARNICHMMIQLLKYTLKERLLMASIHYLKTILHFSLRLISTKLTG